jgi:hypothetical protein
MSMTMTPKDHPSGAAVEAKRAPPPLAANAATAVRPTCDYVMIGARDPLLRVLQTMAEAEAAVMLVSTHSESRKTEHLVGVVTLATVARFLQQTEEIS